MLSDHEFKPFLAQAFAGFRGIQDLIDRLDHQHSASALEDQHGPLIYGRIRSTASEFVAFLDEHGARRNKAYASLAEFAAGTLSFAAAGLELTLLERRLSDPALTKPVASAVDGLQSEVQQSLRFVQSALEALYVAAEKEGRALLEALPAARHHGQPEVLSRQRLAPTLGASTMPDQEAELRQLCSRVLATREVLERFSSNAGFADAEALRAYARKVCDEQQVTFFEARLQNLVSRYDTWLASTSIESEHVSLVALRAQIGIASHVCTFMKELTHFYERHEDDIRCEETKAQIASLVNKDQLLDRVLRFGLPAIHRLLEAATLIADELLQAFTEQRRLDCTIPPGLTLHARPVSLITRIVAHHGTPVQLQIGDHKCYAGSMLDVLMAVGEHASATEVSFEGDADPLRDIELLFEHGLLESGEEVPAELAYLRKQG